MSFFFVIASSFRFVSCLFVVVVSLKMGPFSVASSFHGRNPWTSVVFFWDDSNCREVFFGEKKSFRDVHLRKLIWNPKMKVLKMLFLSKWDDFQVPS